jgi:hypothetical protein
MNGMYMTNFVSILRYGLVGKKPHIFRRDARSWVCIFENKAGFGYTSNHAYQTMLRELKVN